MPSKGNLGLWVNYKPWWYDGVLVVRESKGTIHFWEWLGLPAKPRPGSRAAQFISNCFIDAWEAEREAGVHESQTHIKLAKILGQTFGS